MVYKILKYRRMKVGLQNTIGAVHGAIGPDVQNFVTTTRISPGTWAILDEGPSVAG